MTETDTQRARFVGINHVALEVGDIDDALAFYGGIFAFEIRGRTDSAAFLDAGDQFLALAETDRAAAGDNTAGDDRTADDTPTPDDHRHVGIVVDDASAVERCLADSGAERLSTSGLDFRDPWGNRVQVVAYEDVQFTKADHVLAGMGLSDLGKSEAALAELAEKGLTSE